MWKETENKISRNVDVIPASNVLTSLMLLERPSYEQIILNESY
jgi:hypothetical protein